jgi:hypothetical protein
LSILIAQVNVRADVGGFIGVNTRNFKLSAKSQIIAGVGVNQGISSPIAGEIKINKVISLGLNLLGLAMQVMSKLKLPIAWTFLVQQLLLNQKTLLSVMQVILIFRQVRSLLTEKLVAVTEKKPCLLQMLKPKEMAEI